MQLFAFQNQHKTDRLRHRQKSRGFEDSKETAIALRVNKNAKNLAMLLLFFLSVRSTFFRYAPYTPLIGRGTFLTRRFAAIVLRVSLRALHNLHAPENLKSPVDNSSQLIITCLIIVNNLYYSVYLFLRTHRQRKNFGNIRIIKISI